MPFTPSTEYRSTPRNVVLAFARVPFYPSAWRLIRVSSPHHSSLPILPCSPPSLSISCPNAYLFTIPIFSSVSSCSSSELRFAPSSRKFKYGIIKVGRYQAQTYEKWKWRGNGEQRWDHHPERQTQCWRRIAKEIVYILTFPRRLVLAIYALTITIAISNNKENYRDGIEVAIIRTVTIRAMI